MANESKVKLKLSDPLDQPERLKCSQCGCDHFKINLEAKRLEARIVNSIECEECHEIFTVEIEQ